MTPDQIKALAIKSGNVVSNPLGGYSALFTQSTLAEFVRLVWESALDEAADIVANIVRYTRVEAHDAIRSLE